MCTGASWGVTLAPAFPWVRMVREAMTRTLMIEAMLGCLVLLPAAGQTPGPRAEDHGWRSLFDGKSLDGWRETRFHARGAVRVRDSMIVLERGAPLTGITRTGAVPHGNFEVRFEAARLEGNDFFASLTFPAGQAHCTWVTGGWGGDIVGLSNLDGWDASDNETRTYFDFETGRWYAFRIQVTSQRIRAWIDGRPVINVAIEGRSISLRPGEIEQSAPFGFASYATTGGIRKVEYRELPASADGQ